MAKTILAVDDSSSLRQMVAFSLKAAGYQVVEAVDGQDGLEKAKLQSVDLVLTDQNMPRMDGLHPDQAAARTADLPEDADPDADHRIVRRDESRRAAPPAPMAGWSSPSIRSA
jgi:CheY-like chemotaxis protein